MVSRLNRSINSLRVSSLLWTMASRAALVFECQHEAVNELMNWFFKFLQEVIDPWVRLLYQFIALFLKVVGRN